MRAGPRTLIVGNPENRRVAMFVAALEKRGESADVVPWVDVLKTRVDWYARLDGITRVRIESPGENAEVERALIAAGADEAEFEHPNATRISAADALKLPDDAGRVRYPRQWYLGFRKVLREFERCTAFASSIQWNHTGENILCMFDKIECQAKLARAGVLVPDTLPRIHSYAELLARMNEQRMRRVFIKLANGSSASGVVAFERGETRQQAFTSAHLIRNGGEVQLYNSLKVRRYTNSEDIADVIDTLAREGVQVERWMPKATRDARRFDLRVVVIGGHARHVVVRTSRHPMTNLHLGNARGNAEAIAEQMGPSAWQNAMGACEQALRAFRGSLYAGIDLLIRTDYTRHAVLEVNAFGDLLPNLLHEGESTYEAEISAQPLDADVGCGRST